MKIIAVDDEQIALEGLVRSIKKAAPDAQVEGFRKPRLALDFAEAHGFDVAFLDIEMRSMNGIDCAKRLLAIKPQGNIIFTTGYSDYTLEAFGIHASGYVLKPVTPAKIEQELASLRFPVQENEELETLRIRAFGEFEIFYQGKPLNFKYQRTKELVAYLVDRQGAWCSNAQIKEALFEDPMGKDAYFKQLRKDLSDTLASINKEDLLLHKRGNLALSIDEIECDYIDWMHGKEGGAPFRGEYMTQYSWAENTLATLLAAQPQEGYRV